MCDFTLLYSALLCSALLCSALLYSTLLYSTCSTYSTYSSLLYSTLLYLLYPLYLLNLPTLPTPPTLPTLPTLPTTPACFGTQDHTCLLWDPGPHLPALGPGAGTRDHTHAPLSFITSALLQIIIACYNILPTMPSMKHELLLYSVASSRCLTRRPYMYHI